MSAVKRVISPEEWKNRQINTLKAVGRTNYLEGIKAPKADPIARGIETEGKFADAMRKAIDNEARRKGLEKTDMAAWYKYASTIGADKLVDGVTKREDKVVKFVTTFHPLLVSHLAKIDALAEETDADRENRMLENLRGLKALKGKA